jgi:hypothetical protein
MGMSEVARGLAIGGNRPHDVRLEQRLLHGMGRFSPKAQAMWASIEGKRPSTSLIEMFVAEVPADVRDWWQEEAYVACRIPPTPGQKVKQQVIEDAAYLDEMAERAHYEFCQQMGYSYS